MAAKEKKSSTKSSLPLLLVFVGVLGVVAPPTLLVMLVGMLPSIVGIVISPARVKPAMASMFSLNLAGVLPVIGFLWQRGQTFERAFQLLTDVYMWGLMFGSAGLAAFLIWGVPIGVHAVYELQANTLTGRLKKRREKLVEEWGGQIFEDAKIMPAKKKQ